MNQPTATTRGTEYDYQAARDILAALERAATDPAYFDGLLAAHHNAGRPDIAASAARAVASIQQHNAENTSAA